MLSPVSNFEEKSEYKVADIFHCEICAYVILQLVVLQQDSFINRI